MSTIIREAKYIKSDIRNNNNKFWYITLFDNNSITTQYGRVGDSGQSRTKDFGSQMAASSFFDKKCKEKERNGRNGEIAYRPLNVIEGAGIIKTSSKNVDQSRLKEIAKKQIKTKGNPIVTKLIEYLTKVNAHNITSSTGGQITFNDTTGLFSTPLGVITQDNIDDANNILVKIGDMVSKQTYGSRMLERTNDYLMLVPQDIGRKKLEVRNFWSNIQEVQKQKAIVDSLQASLVSATTNPVTNKKIDIPEEKVFNVELSLVDNKKTISWINKKYNQTKNNIHACSHLKVKKIYNVEIADVKNSYDKCQTGNIMQLFHGSLTSNLLSILKGGLRMPTSSSSNVTGKMFSGYPGKEGLYFSDQSSKAANYSYGYWKGSHNSNCFMFLCDIRMGKYYTPSGPHDGPFPKNGYDSTFAKGHRSGVMNNEMIVYNTAQVNLNYLIELA